MPRPYKENERVTLSGKPPAPGMELEGAPQPLKENGQHGDYWVLSAEEIAKGFVRPVRYTYIHKTCGTATSMSDRIAETYARDPAFYGSTFCCGCGTHFPLINADGERQFIWSGSSDAVGD